MRTVFAPWLIAGCIGTELDDEGDDGSMCPPALPVAATTCGAAPMCQAAMGNTTIEGELDGARSAKWIAVSWISSEINENQNVNFAYTKAAGGALLPERPSARERAADRHDAETLAYLYDPRIDARIRAEARLRSAWPDHVDPFAGTGIHGRSKDLLPKGVHRQSMMCSRSARDCGGAAVCVLDGAGMGTCESAVTIKLRAEGQNDDIAATVRKVGAFAAILTDDADTVADSDVDALLMRFDEHIAPIDHALFGEAKIGGDDFDGNGVALVLLTSKVANIDANLVGFFYPVDMEDPAMNPASNGADLLYMQPPSASVPIDAVSGTLAHEYQHLINFLAKADRGSSPEAAWLDEGLAGFAEDATGYGADAFTNVMRYLEAVSETSLTGFGLTYDTEQTADSSERRGMAHLFVRLIFERKGGATFGGAGAISGSGVPAVKGLVQTADTGLDTLGTTNRKLHDWLGDLLATVALDGTSFKDVSCNDGYQLEDPVMSTFTGRPIGIDLRGSFQSFQGMTVTLRGPTTTTLEMEEVLVPANGGEIRTVDVTGKLDIGFSAPGEDFRIGMTPIPTAL
jgi:hypothetical protein